ncbi:C1 family peptidase [Desulfovibrio sp. TomC]|uniref:C1 family peptidase n=1 Tax=Desulfovibrio sp. TomC TaxID=1562888 RepID=UPI000574E1B5|nr:C1 family peptidase [Desulfovibrio sp. TomC]KHK03920.1 FB22 precursor [Desulfovibrio sp. TomC]
MKAYLLNLDNGLIFVCCLNSNVKNSIYKIIIFLVLRVLMTSASYADGINNIPAVDEINSAIQKKGASWVAKENKFTHMPQEQLDLLVGKEADALKPTTNIKTMDQINSGPTRGISGVSDYPTKLDYRNINGKDYTTAVKQQSSCGACVMFAALRTLESLEKIKADLPQWKLNLSEQYLLSCPEEKNCSGNAPDGTHQQLIDTGVVQERYSPYLAQVKPCSEVFTADMNTIGNYRIGEFFTVRIRIDTPDPVGDFKKILNVYGPFIAIMFVPTEFYAYGGGVYTVVQSRFSGMHAVTVVGYDDDARCFIVKNSWGDTWGEKGYFIIAYSEVDVYSGTMFAVDNYVLGGTYVHHPEPTVTPSAKLTYTPPAAFR